MSILRWGNPAEVLASIPAMLPQLTVPTLIFQGSRDKAVPERFAQRACALIPQSKVIMVDSGHFIPLNNPDVVATELLRFFGESPPRPAPGLPVISAPSRGLQRVLRHLPPPWRFRAGWEYP